MGSMVWTVPRRVDSLFFVQLPLARRVTRQRSLFVMPLQPPDYETPPPRKPVGFLSKCNPRATAKTVVRSAVVYALAGAAIWLFGVVTKPGFWSTWRTSLPGLSLSGAFCGAVCEWQVDRERL